MTTALRIADAARIMREAVKDKSYQQLALGQDVAVPAPGPKTALEGGTWRRWESNPRNVPGARRGISPASPSQRTKARSQTCLVCGADTVDPAHLVARSLGGCDHEDCVVALCRTHHRAYDTGTLDLLPYLEPTHRRELAHAVEHAGLIGALRKITNVRWEAR